jgi:hypothetical protein
MTEFTDIYARRGKLIGWTVMVDAESVKVLLTDLPVPEFPTIHQIRHTARAKLSGIPADKVAFAMAKDECHAMALHEWERVESIRKACCKLANMDWRKCGKVEDSYRDHSTVIGFDTAAKSAAYELPELGWNPDDDNGDALWSIISTRPAARPRISDHSTTQMAIASLTIRRVPVEVIPF